MDYKKAVSVLMAGTLAAGLTACGSTKDSNGESGATASPAAQSSASAAPQEETLQPEKGAKLLVWDSGDQKDFILEVGKAFEAKYGVKVEYAEVGADKAMNQMLTDGPAGVGADVFKAVHDRTGSGASAGVILPNDFFEDETKKSAYDTAISAVTINNMLYGYPVSVETTAVYYNKDLIPSVPDNWQGVIDFAKKFNDPAANKYAYMWEAGNGYWSYGIFSGYGAYVFGKNGTDANDIGMNNAGAVDAGKFFQGLKDILPVKTGDINGDIRKSLFEQGKLAMNVSGPWDKGSYQKVVKNLGVAPYPKLPNGKPMKPFSGVKAIFVNASTKYPNAAKLFANFISSPEWQMKNYEQFGNLPADKTVAASDKIKNDPIAAGFLKQFETSEPMPSIAEMKLYWDTVEAALGAIWNDKADVKTSLDAMVKQMKDGIAASKK
ncbi:sugar ABC transporter substrate-binding protein [Gorillibacterium sp. sgz5001074]|uniref:sugar ABC transporter substrate-binding protein n=1 Tax=Gorillibacterium sp. sgz5001074 TaxID=3446695 RepID=UPI003F67B220